MINIFTPQIRGEHFHQNSIEQVFSFPSFNLFFCATVKTQEQLIFVLFSFSSTMRPFVIHSGAQHKIFSD
jgi:hypothetical protein